MHGERRKYQRNVQRKKEGGSRDGIVLGIVVQENEENKGEEDIRGGGIVEVWLGRYMLADLTK